MDLKAITPHLQLMMSASQEVVDSLMALELGWIVVAVALLYLGLAVTGVLLWLIRFIYVYFLRPGKNLKFYGSWAMITGATDGIGKAYCIELAKKGLNLVLISRNKPRLDEFAQELASSYGVQTRVCALDLCKLDAEGLDRIGAVLEGIEVGLLINNAGMSYDHPEYLEATTVATDIDLININVTAPTLLTKLVLPGMKQRGRGAIVNIGSANGLLPAVPLLCTYAGTKAFISQFSRSLSVEAGRFGVSVQDQCPFFVATKMSKIKRARLDAPTPKIWAQAAVRQIGYETVHTPYWYHGVMLAVIEGVLPTASIKRYVLKLHLGFRAAFYRRQAREATSAATAAEASEAKKGN